MIPDFLSVYLLIGLMFGLLLTGIRLVIGPGLADRFVALDMMTVLAIGITALTTLVTGRREFLDIGLGLAVTGFVATVALAVFLERKETDE
ncbi:MAG TPA: cation transporter [Oceanicaulis sp.]|jgi:multisubunit Na+/H+ antiporter MnhF subunit|uniref:Cation:proton antiporter n=1 Tax=Glycocaulis albus TaxID=1382801 RepID=A0ABQ1XRR1_9PROT|nr:monovalent cation/H+ antiporter complex subunit F [Glycocaulis albus]MBV5259362.1 cation transporter [Synechococcus moorigangaii CMS01]GGH01508.1 cation:proton antiporter [Glycocaulis albus]HCY55108.1 cation transporter [Oceanicaulis sp.]